MNEVALDKIIRKIIYPKYPYIVDHEIDVYSDDGDASWGINPSKTYTVNLYVGKKEIEGVDMEVVLSNMDKAKKIVSQLFDALGFDRDDSIVVNYSLNDYRR